MDNRNNKSKQKYFGVNKTENSQTELVTCCYSSKICQLSVCLRLGFLISALQQCSLEGAPAPVLAVLLCFHSAEIVKKEEIVTSI